MRRGSRFSRFLRSFRFLPSFPPSPALSRPLDTNQVISQDISYDISQDSPCPTIPKTWFRGLSTNSTPIGGSAGGGGVVAPPRPASPPPGPDFESGEVKYVILRLLREKPATATRSSRRSRSGSAAGTPFRGDHLPDARAAGDQGYVRAVEEEGRRSTTSPRWGGVPGAAQGHHRGDLRPVRDTVRDVAGARWGW